MDMQDVSNLVIPEGEVRAIHDEENRLLWGRLNYNTRYMGNIIQDGAPTPDSPQNVNVVTGTQTVNVMGKNLCYDIQRPTTNSIRFFFSKALSSSTITISTALNVATASNTISLWVDNSNIGNIGTFSGSAGETISRTFTFTASQMSAIQSGSEICLQLYKSNAGFTLPTWAQIELGSPATAYEPYQSQSYTVNLGSTELCKLGTHQDYIYKSGNDWYVHKAIGKTVLDGSEDWFKSGTSAIDRFGVPNTYFGGVTSMSSSTTISDHFVYNSGAIYGTYHISGANVYFDYTPNGTTTKNQWVAWLSSNHTTVYYVVGTPTDTKITDATLIAQLDAVHQFLTRYGYNGAVSGNLPIIIDRTNL